MAIIASRMKSYSYLLSLMTLITFCGCQKAAPPTVGKQDGVQDQSVIPQTRTLAEAKEIALKAKDELFTRLSGRLMEEIQSGGPAKAIKVCSEEAKTIAESVGIKHDVLIGRTSLKLRNNKNTPPVWSVSMVEKQMKEPQWLEVSEAHYGALLPIILKVQCTTCHGPVELLAPDVKAQLKELYPDDRATGFVDGDLRGYFWVEVPNVASK